MVNIRMPPENILVLIKYSFCSQLEARVKPYIPEELTLLHGVQARRSSPDADDQIQSKLGLDLVHNGECTLKSCRSRLYSGHYHEGCRDVQYLSMNRTTMLNVNKTHFYHASPGYEEVRYHPRINVLDLYFRSMSFVILHKREVAEVSVDRLFRPTYSRAWILLWISWAKTVDRHSSLGSLFLHLQ